MKKILLLFALITANVMGAWALCYDAYVECVYVKLNKMPTEAVLTNMEFNSTKGTLQFNDKSTLLPNCVKHSYRLLVGKTGGRFCAVTQDEADLSTVIRYYYGIVTGVGTTGMNDHLYETESYMYPEISSDYEIKNNESKIELDINDLLDQIEKAGLAKAYIFIVPVYYMDGVHDYLYPYSMSIEQGEFLCNNIEIELGVARKSNLSARDEEGDTIKATLHHDYNLELDVKTIGATTCVLQSMVDGKKWQDLTTDYITAGVAKEGTVVSNVFSIEARASNVKLRYKLDVEHDSTKTSIYSNELVFDLNYTLKRVDTDETIDMRSGDTYNLGKNNDCEDWRFLLNGYLDTTRNSKGELLLTMHTSDVEVEKYTKVYDINFYDMDGKLIDAQKIACGNSAVAPDAPAHKGYTFVKWAGNYENVNHSSNVRAVYSNDFFGFEAYNFKLLSHKSKLNEFDGSLTKVCFKYDTLNTQFYVKYTAAVDLQMQYSIDGGDWKNYGTKTTVTKTQATQGKTIDNALVFKNNTWANVKDLKLRYCVTSGENTAYTDVFKFDMYYPVVVDYTFDGEIVTPESSQFFIYDENGTNNATVVVSVGDTVFFKAANGHNGCIDYSTTWQDKMGVSKEGITYLATDAETCEDVIGVSVFIPAYQVEFYLNAEDATMEETALMKQTVSCGDMVENPGTPTREGFVFTGWDKSLINPPFDERIGAVLKYYATWTETASAHKVTFMYEEGVVIDEVFVADGGIASVPPVKEFNDKGEKFEKWDNSYVNVTEDRVLYAVYKATSGVESVASDKVRKTIKIIDDNKILIILPDGTCYDAVGVRQGARK